MTLGQNGVLRYGHFGEFLEDRMANFGLIDLKFGLYIKVNINAGKTNLKFITNKLAKMAINWHKIGQMPLWHKII